MSRSPGERTWYGAAATKELRFTGQYWTQSGVAQRVRLNIKQVGELAAPRLRHQPPAAGRRLSAEHMRHADYVLWTALKETTSSVDPLQAWVSGASVVIAVIALLVSLSNQIEAQVVLRFSIEVQGSSSKRLLRPRASICRPATGRPAHTRPRPSEATCRATRRRVLAALEPPISEPNDRYREPTARIVPTEGRTVCSPAHRGVAHCDHVPHAEVAPLRASVT